MAVRIHSELVLLRNPLTFIEALKKIQNDSIDSGSAFAPEATSIEGLLRTKFTLEPHEFELLLHVAVEKNHGKRYSRFELTSSNELVVNSKVWTLFHEWVERRMKGELLQHLTGEQQFLDHFFEVGPDVLIPRPETETLVEVALQNLDRVTGPLTGLEVGLGSGVISVTLALKLQGLQMFASEVSESAIEVANRNIKKLTASVTVLKASSTAEVLEPWLRRREQMSGRGHSHSFESFAEPGPKKNSQEFAHELNSHQTTSRSLDFIISNPPYLLPTEANDDVAQHEPSLALYAPPADPLFFYRRIAEGAPSVVKPGGWIFLEIPHERAQEIYSLFSRKVFSSVHLEKDLNDRPRVLVAQLV